MTCNIDALVTRCRVLDDGFVAPDESNSWRLGTVLLLRLGSALAAVQKVGPADYPFRDSWSLPGGMVRARHAAGSETVLDAPMLLRSSLAARAAAEAGIAPEDHGGLRLSTVFGPIVTSYLAKGAIRFTLIAVQAADATRRIELAAADPSVRNACWLRPPFDWASLAPANRLLIAHALWSGLTPMEMEAAQQPVAAATDECAAWSYEMGWRPAPPPWADTADVQRWRESWI